MATKHKFAMAMNPMTGQLEWTPIRQGSIQSLVGWVILAASTLVFLLVAGYFVYLFLLSSPSFDLRNAPGGGDSAMRQEVQHLRQVDQQR